MSKRKNANRVESPPKKKKPIESLFLSERNKNLNYIDSSIRSLKNDEAISPSLIAQVITTPFHIARLWESTHVGDIHYDIWFNIIHRIVPRRASQSEALNALAPIRLVCKQWYAIASRIIHISFKFGTIPVFIPHPTLLSKLVRASIQADYSAVCSIIQLTSHQPSTAHQVFRIVSSLTRDTSLITRFDIKPGRLFQLISAHTSTPFILEVWARNSHRLQSCIRESAPDHIALVLGRVKDTLTPEMVKLMLSATNAPDRIFAIAKAIPSSIIIRNATFSPENIQSKICAIASAVENHINLFNLYSTFKQLITSNLDCSPGLTILISGLLNHNIRCSAIVAYWVAACVAKSPHTTDPAVIQTRIRNVIVLISWHPLRNVYPYNWISTTFSAQLAPTDKSGRCRDCQMSDRTYHTF